MSTFGKWSAADVAAHNKRNEQHLKRTNLSAGDSRENAVVEHGPIPVPLAAVQTKEAGPERVFVRFVSVRKFLLDPDNLCEKWYLDCLRLICAIRGDEPEAITLETTQRKVEKGEGEHTEITVFKL